MSEFVRMSEKRGGVRYAVTGKPNVKLTTVSDKEITFFIVDVSARGLGIILADKLKTNDALVLEFLDEPRAIIKLEVRWILACDNLNETIFGSEQLYRCGLLAPATDYSLLEMIKSNEGVLVEALI